ncbi:DUF2574 family protein [Superficieibacter sp.]|uniref:DUF2574 family protein n=1 Tax=Superficieibacter sp. TaxID=2303322 RepID=UPI0028B167B8|nr:DUF2574 family protein [Superficieibacter sp.]
MKRRFLAGLFVLIPAMSAMAVASDSTTLTINGHIVVATCSADAVGERLQQRCGSAIRFVDAHSPAARGVVSEVVSVAGVPGRQILLSRYD